MKRFSPTRATGRNDHTTNERSRDLFVELFNREFPARIEQIAGRCLGFKFHSWRHGIAPESHRRSEQLMFNAQYFKLRSQR